MFEVLQGMLNRPDWEAARQLPLVQIPAGSGNGLAASTGACAPGTCEAPSAGCGVGRSRRQDAAGGAAAARLGALPSPAANCAGPSSCGGTHAHRSGSTGPAARACLSPSVSSSTPPSAPHPCAGLWDVTTAVHALVKGCTSPMDVSSVLQPPARRVFSFLSLTYGMIPNLDIGTDHLRWMGSPRFVLGAIHQIMKQGAYPARVSFVDVRHGVVQGAGHVEEGTNGAGPPMRHIGAFQSLPDGAWRACLEYRSPGWEWAQEASGACCRGFIVKRAVSWMLHPQACASDLTLSASCKPHTPHAINLLQAGSSGIASLDLPAPWQPLLAGEVQFFAACNIPWLDTNFHVAPGTLLHDGGSRAGARRRCWVRTLTGPECVWLACHWTRAFPDLSSQVSPHRQGTSRCCTRWGGWAGSTASASCRQWTAGSTWVASPSSGPSPLCWSRGRPVSTAGRNGGIVPCAADAEACTRSGTRARAQPRSRALLAEGAVWSI